jgi:multiple sugar transport system substrate-binding protein
VKTLLAVTLLVLVAMTAFVTGTLPKDEAKGRIPLVWATDPNPDRDRQVKLFNELSEKRADEEEEKLPEGEKATRLHLRIDPNNSGREKVIVQSLAGVGPDVFDYWGYGNFDAYIKSGIAWDVTDALKSRGFDPEKMIWPLAKPWTITKEGRVYGIPANVGSDAIWFNKNLFDRAGVPYPKEGWTPAELIETAEKLTERDAQGNPVRYGFLIDFGGGYNHFLASFGGQAFSDDGRTCTVDSPESIACLTFMHDLIYKYRVSPSPQEEQAITTGGGWGGGAGPMAYFRREVGAMALGGRWWLAQLRNDLKTGMRLGSVPPPIFRYPRFSSGGTRAVMINARSPRREEALDFLVYLLEQPYNQLLNDQGDALSGVREYSYTDRYLNNPEFPGQDFHGAFRKTLEMAVEQNRTPYLPQSEVDLYLNRQLDMVKLNLKKPEQALRDAKRDIQAAMARWIDRNPDLKAEYEAGR